MSETGRLFINSAQRLSRERVDAAFPGVADAHGSISYSEQKLPPEAIVGKECIRKAFAPPFASLTGQESIWDERTRQLLRRYPTGLWRGVVPYTLSSSLAAHAQVEASARNEGVAVRSKHLLAGKEKKS